jgi:hypothetical protein
MFASGAVGVVSLVKSVIEFCKAEILTVRAFLAVPSSARYRESVLQVTLR